jgi:aspartate/methionine/tyrosine aminotransferase
MVVSGDLREARDYIEGLDMLASMRLCANVPAQHAIQTALGGYQSIDDLVAPGGRMCRQRDLAHAPDYRHPRGQLRQAEGGALHVSAARSAGLSDRQ